MRLARLDGGAIAEYPLTFQQARRQKSNVSFPANPPKETLEAVGYTLVENTPRPSTGFGETTVEGAPELVDGTWRQTWQVQSITLAEAKQQLAQMAARIYLDKALRPTLQQLVNSSGIAAAIQARDNQIRAKFDDVIARIQAASSGAEAFAIYQELEAFE